MHTNAVRDTLSIHTDDSPTNSTFCEKIYSLLLAAPPLPPSECSPIGTAAHIDKLVTTVTLVESITFQQRNDMKSYSKWVFS